MSIHECHNLSVRADCLPLGPQDPLSMVCHPALDPGGLTYVDGFKSFLWLPASGWVQSMEVQVISRRPLGGRRMEADIYCPSFLPAGFLTSVL